MHYHEIKLGIISGGGGSQRALRLVGATKAMEMITTGDPITAAEAHQIGLVNLVVPGEKLWETVEAFSARLIIKSPSALAVAKKLICQGGNVSLYKGIQYDLELFSEILLTADAAEGTKAFLEKRTPVFKGR